MIILANFGTREACVFTFKNKGQDNFFLDCFRNSYQNWLNFIICHRWHKLNIVQINLATTASFNPEKALQILNMQSNAYSVWEQIPIGLLFFFKIPYHPLLTKLNKPFNYKNQQKIFWLMLNCQYILSKNAKQNK